MKTDTNTNIILACADNVLKSKLFQTISTTGKYSLIACADNGFSFLQKFGRFNDMADIIITDLFLEGVSGIEVLQQIREHNNSIKLIAYSTYFQSSIYVMLKDTDGYQCRPVCRFHCAMRARHVSTFEAGNILYWPR
jgi:DNA-binding NarL/FixJ family response regulator